MVICAQLDFEEITPTDKMVLLHESYSLSTRSLIRLAFSSGPGSCTTRLLQVIQQSLTTDTQGIYHSREGRMQAYRREIMAKSDPLANTKPDNELNLLCSALIIFQTSLRNKSFSSLNP